MITLSVNPQYVTDTNGHRIGVLLDIETYERMLEALEDIEDVRLYDENINAVKDEIETGSYLTLDEYISKRTAG